MRASVVAVVVAWAVGCCLLLMASLNGWGVGETTPI